MPKVISFVNQKGGVGKTLLTFSVAGILSRLQKRTLLIDLDPQANLTANIGIDKFEKDINACNIFYDKKPAKDLIIPTKLRHVSIISGSPSMTAVEFRITKEQDREFMLKKFIQSNDLHDYEYILIDTSPSFSALNQNGFLASDSIIIVSDVDMNSLDGAELFTSQLKQIRTKYGIMDNVKGFILNHYDKRTKLAKEYRDVIKNHEQFGQIMMKTIVPYSVKYKESILEQHPVIKGEHYRIIDKLVKEMMKRGVL